MKQLCRAALVSVGCALLGSSPTFAATTDFGEFSLKVAFTIDYDGADTLSGIPVLVKLAPNSPAGFSYADCAADGSDLRFAIEGGSALPFEIDTWNPEGESFVWVKPPAVTKGTTFALYYSGTPSVANDPTAVWTEYSGVWHLGTLGTDTTPNSQGLYANSTAATGIDAHLSSQSVPGEAGKFGQAFRPNDSTGCKLGNYNEGGAWVVDPGTDSPLDGNSTSTISGWFKHIDCNYANDKMIYKRLNSNNSDSPNGSFVMEVQSTSADHKIAVKGSGDSRVRDDSLVGPNPRAGWVYVTGVYNGKAVSLYENGSLIKSSPYLNQAPVDNDAPLVFGNTVTIANGETGSCAWNGWIDEVRYLKSAKSAEWLAAEYAAMAKDDFLLVGNVENIGGGIVPPSLGLLTVEPGIYAATISGEVLALGTDATSCDVYLALGPTLAGLGEPVKILEGVTGAFTYEISGLEQRTMYCYELTVQNNFVSPQRVLRTGNFKTKVDPEKGLEPTSTPAETRALIQEALDDAALESPAGTVVLNAGTFEIDAQLMVVGGVTLVGQGHENTILKYVGTANTADSRVATLSDGATLRKVTVTGAKVGQNGYVGGAVTITGTEGATISWCCITNNLNGNACGGGIGIYGSGSVKIDHTIVANNTVGVNVAAVGGGIGTRPGADGLSVEIDSCLIYGNTAGKSSNDGSGGGIGIIYKKIADGDTDLSRISTTIRNTTIANNTVVGSGKGGGLYCTQKGLVLQNCIITDNSASTDMDVGYLTEDIADQAQPANCLIGVDPFFKDAAKGDYHLLCNSPAVATGMVYEGLGVDLDGHPYGTKPSIGCYQKDRSGLLLILR